MLTTIPASTIVNVIPSVLTAGGAAIATVGLMLTESNRIPTGAPTSFASQAAVAAYFGANSLQASLATTYFNGFTGCTALPANLLVAQYPGQGASAWARGASLAATSLQALQAFSGSLTVSVDGYSRSAANVNLSTAGSFSAAAGLIQTALNSILPTQATFSLGSTAQFTTNFTASITGNVLNVSAVASGTLQVGGSLAGGGISGLSVLGQISGSLGQVGSYALSGTMSLGSTALTQSYGILTVAGTLTGTLAVGQTLSGTNVPASTLVMAQLTGTLGGIGTYIVNNSFLQSAEAMITTATPVVVTFDAILFGFLITSGVVGAASTIGFVSGTLAASIGLTQSAGATISQGANFAQPNSFMTALVAFNTNFATFFTDFDPDWGTGNAQKQLFAQWNSTVGLNRFAYVAWDPDQSPVNNSSAPASLGALVTSLNYAGTEVVSDSTPNTAAFVSGYAASINWGQRNGRQTLAYRSQAGLQPVITTAAAAANLNANNYDYVGGFASANTSFILFYNGNISGPFAWFDSYLDQIWMNASFQLALLALLSTVGSVPYNDAGNAQIEAALQTPIQAALNFGAIRQGITLSSSELATVLNVTNNPNVVQTLQTRGWYLFIGTASPAVRAARGTPPATFFYTDGQAVQQITLASVEIQ